MRLLPLLVCSLLTFAIVGGCESAPQSPSASPGPSVVGGTECAGLPTLSGDNPSASFELTRDPELEAAFPEEIGGAAVTNPQSARLVETICLFGGQSGVDDLRSQAPLDLDLSNLFVGSADATVEGSTITLTAFHAEGGDAAQLLQSIRGLTVVAGGDPDKFSGELTETEAGGKTVQTWTDANGRTSYLYAAGDVLFVVDGISASQADKVFAAF